MQKFLRTLTLLACLALPWVTQAQNTLTVADGTATNSNVPIYGLYVDDYLRCQTIYPASMIEEAAGAVGMNGGSITSLTYYMSTPAAASWGNANFEIKIKEVAATTLSAFVDMSGATTVYTGSINGTVSPMVITLTTPYTYHGGNLIIEVNNIVKGTYKSCTFTGVESTGATWQGNGSSAWASIAGAAKNFIPKTTFTFNGGTPITCRSIATLDTSNASATGVTLTWTDNPNNTGASYSIYKDDQYIASVPAGTLTYTATGLTANKGYIFSVRAKCSADDSAAVKSFSFRTPCGVVALPFEDGMEAVASGSNPMPLCWARYNTSTSSTYNTYPRAYTSGYHSGSRCLYFNGYNGTAGADTMIAIMPEIDPTANPLNTLLLNFWAKKSASNAITVKVGTMSDPEDGSTFVADTTLELTTTYAEYGVRFKHSPATNAYIAIMVLKPTTTTNVYVDDIYLEAPTCWRPTDFAASNIAAKSLHLSWANEMSPNASYELTYTLLGKTRKQIVNDTACDVTNLRPETYYTFNLRAICGEGDTARAVTCSATTKPLCEPVSNLRVTGATKNRISLAWDASPTAGAKYRIYCFQLSSDPIADNVTGTTRNINGLEPSSDYNFYVYAFNANGDVSDVRYVSATTLCETKALADVNEDFESYYTGSSYYPDCWGKIGTASVYPYSSYTHSGSRDLYFASSTAQVIAVMPEFEIPTSGFRMTFYARPGAWATTEFVVGYVTNAFDANSFVKVDTVEFTANAYVEKTVAFTNMPAGARVAFRKNATSSSKTVYLDDITFEEIMACPKPENLQVVATGDGGQLTWTASTGALKYIVYVDGDSIAEPTTNSYTITGLAGSSNYTVSVAAVCTNGLTAAISAPLNTLCPVAELPLSFVAADYATGVNFPACWTPIDDPSIASSDALSIVYQDGYNAIRFATYSSQGAHEQYLISPEIPTTGVKQLVLGGVKCTSTSGNDALYYGYSTTDKNTSSFTWTLVTKATIYTDYNFQIPAGAKYVALKYTGTYAYRYYVRSINLSVQPTCAAPTNLQVSSITATGATLNWEAVTGVTKYIVYVNGDSIAAPTTTNYTIAGLTPATNYTVGVAAICPAGDVTSATSEAIATLCGAETTPFVESFDMEIGGCWNQYDGLFSAGAPTGTTNGWSRATTAPFTDGHYKVNIYGTDCKYWLVTPPIAVSANDRLDFDVAFTDYGNGNEPESVGDDDKFIVAITTDNGATWTALSTWDNSAQHSLASIPHTGTHVNIPLANYANQTVRIAFYGESTVSNADNDLRIDNVMVAEPPTCYAPAIASVDATAGRSAVVTLAPNAESLSNEEEYIYVVEENMHYYPTQTPDWDNADTTDALTFTLNGLEPETDYLIWVRANCGTTDGMSTVVSGDFTTGTSCAVPTNLQVTDIHHNVAKFSWEGNAAEYEFLLNTEWDMSTATRTIVTATEYGPELEKLTTYYAWVRAICGEGDTSLSYAMFTPFTTNCTYDPCYVSLIALDTVASDGWQEAMVTLYQDGRNMGSVTIDDNATKKDSNTVEIPVCANVAIELVLTKGYFDEENAIAVYDQDGNDLYHNNHLDTIADRARIASFASPCPDVVPPVKYLTTIGEMCIDENNTTYNWQNGNFSKLVDVTDFVDANDTTVQFTHFVSQYEAQVLMLDIHHTGVENLKVRVCESYEWDLNHSIYTESTVDTFNYTANDPSIVSFYGCDSIAVLNLTIDTIQMLTIDTAICANDMIWNEETQKYSFVINGTEDTITSPMTVDRYFDQPIVFQNINVSALFDSIDPLTLEVVIPAFVTEHGCYQGRTYNFTFNPIVRNYIDTAACYTFTWDRTGNSWSFDRDEMADSVLFTYADTAYSVDTTTGCMVMDILASLKIYDTLYKMEYPEAYGYYIFNGEDYTNTSLDEDLFLSFRDTTESTALQCGTVTDYYVTIHPYTTLHHYYASDLDTLTVFAYYDDNLNPVNVNLTATGTVTKTEYRDGRTGNIHVFHYTKLDTIAPVCNLMGSENMPVFNIDLVDGEGTTHTVEASAYIIEAMDYGVVRMMNADSVYALLMPVVFDKVKKTVTLNFSTADFNKVPGEIGFEPYDDTLFKGEPVEITYAFRYNNPQTIDSTVKVCDNKFPFTWNDSVFVDENATHTFYRTDVNGCDSIVNVSLLVLPTGNRDTVAVACDSLKWRGMTFYSSIDTFKVVGKSHVPGATTCDSIVHLQLTINNATDTNLSVFAEYGYNLQMLNAAFQDTTYMNTNYRNINNYGPFSTIDSCYIDSVYTRTLKLANGNVKGCDSTINLTLTVHPDIFIDSTIISSTGAYYFNHLDSSELFVVPSGLPNYEYYVNDLYFGYDTLDNGTTQGYGNISFTIKVGSTSEIADNHLAECGHFTWDRNGVTYFSLTEEEKTAHPVATYKYLDVTTGEYVFVDPNNQPYVIDTNQNNPDVIANNGFAVRYRLNLVLAPAKFYSTVKDNYPLSLGMISMADVDPDLTPAVYYFYSGNDQHDTTYSFTFSKDTTGEYCEVIHNVVLNVVNNYDTIDTVICATQSRFTWYGVRNTVTPTTVSITLNDTNTVLDQFTKNIDSTNVLANTFTYKENEGTESEMVHSVRIYQYPTAFKTDNLKVCDSLVWERNGETYYNTTNEPYYFGLDETVGCNINYMLNLTVNDKIYVTDTAVCDSLIWHGITFYDDTLGFEYTGVELNEMFYPTTGYGEACPMHYVLNLDTVYRSLRVYTDTVNDFALASGERAMQVKWDVDDEMYPIEDQSVVVEEGDNYKVYRDSVMRIEKTVDGCPIYDVLMLTIYSADTVEATHVKHFCENDEATYTYGNKTFNKANPTGYAYFYTDNDFQDSVVKVQVTYGNVAYEDVDSVFSGDVFNWVVNGDTTAITFDDLPYTTADYRTGNFRIEYVSEETFCPVIARLNLKYIEPDYEVLRERELPYTYTTHGTDSVITEAGEYVINWAENDPTNVELNGKGYTRLYVIVNPIVNATVDTLVCWTPDYVMNVDDLYTDGDMLYVIDEDTTFHFTANSVNTVHVYATDIFGLQDYDVTFNFTVRDTHNITYNVVSCAAYYWDYDETTYSNDTVVSYPSTDIFGCPNTITLNFTLGNETVVEVPVTACGSYTLNDSTYTESTDVIVPGPTSAAGCATSTIYHITIYNVEPIADTQVVCGSSYSWNGNVYTQSGEYTLAHLDALTNCPVTDTLRLTLNVPMPVVAIMTACGDYTWNYNGETYTTSGVYTVDTVDANGCDITATLYLTVTDADTIVLPSVTACDSYTWNGMVLTESGEYTFTTASIAGCDSTTVLPLVINNSVVGLDTTATSCGVFTWNGEIYVQSGDYEYSYPAANGCDSTVTLHLTINNDEATTVPMTACDSYTWEATGQTYTASGDYLYTTQTIHGCDSTVTLALTINSSDSTSVETTAAGSFEWNGTVYTESGDYTWRGTNVAGCDSVVTLHLTIVAQTYTVTVTVNDATMGNVNPSGAITVAAGETFTATATANDGYRFVNWSNGATTATVEIVVNEDITLTANFEVIKYIVDVTSADETMGTVTGSGEYLAGATVVVEAIANNGYVFDHWSDGTTNAHYEFTATQDVTLVAYFRVNDGIDDVEGINATIYSVDNTIVVKGAENMDIYVYDVNGRCVRKQANATETVEFTMNVSGVYLVKVANAPAKRVVVVR